MGYLLCIFRLPDYDMPALTRKDVVLLALTKLPFTDSCRNFFYAETNNWRWTNRWSISNEVNINSKMSFQKNSRGWQP